MGNQNASGIHEEDKAAGNPSNNERTAAKEDQLIHPTADTKELSAASALSDHDLPGEAGNHHLDDQTLEIKDDVKDAILNSTGAVLHEPDAPVHSDAEVDDHVLEKINQDPFFRESKVTSCSIDEISINGAEGEIGLTAGKMLAAEDHIKEVINAEEEECETNGKNHPEMSSIEQVNEGDKSSNALHHQEIFHTAAISDALIEHLNTKDETLLHTEEAEVTKGINCNDEKIGESGQVNRHDHGDSEGSEDDQTDDIWNANEDSEAEKEPEIADLKDIEIVDAKADDSNGQSNPQEAGSEAETRENKCNGQVRISSDKQQNTQSQMQKSPSFNFDLMSWDRNDELDQTPLLYHKKLGPMRSLSSPGNAQFLIPLSASAEEKTIKTVQERRRETDNEPLLKKKEETHLLKPQQNHEKVGNNQNLEIKKELHEGQGMQIVPSIKEKSNKSRISGSNFFSICICCTGVAQLNRADP